jgi:TorA maturation chaperone TorD
MTVNEICETHKGRDVSFNILSRAFMDVPDDLSDRQAADTFAFLLALAEHSDNEDLKAGAQMLKSMYPEDSKEIFSYLTENRLDRAKDYTFLFVLGRGSVPQYESIYLSPEKLVKQEPWSEVKAAYAANGFKRAEKNKTMEDHVALELQFMGLLSKRTAQMIEAENFDEAEAVLKAQSDFYAKHVNRWIPTFCDNVISKSEKLHSKFYPAYAHLLKGFLTEDMLLLEDLLGE